MKNAGLMCQPGVFHIRCLDYLLCDHTNGLTLCLKKESIVQPALLFSFVAKASQARMLSVS